MFKKIAQYIKSFFAKPPKGERRMADIGRGSLPETVMLRERVLRVEFELSARNIKRFVLKHRLPVVSILSGLLAVVLVVRFALFGFASTAVFFPSSCLGSWDNVANALGEPDLSPGTPLASFNALNSAIFSTGTAQMFCGNFSGNTNIADLQGKSFQSAYLVLSWNVAPPGSVLEDAVAPTSTTVATTTAETASTTNIISGGGGGGGGGGVSAQPAPTPAPAADTTAPTSTDSSIPTAPNSQPTSTSPAPDNSSTTPSVATTTTATTTTTSSDASASTTINTATTTITDTSTTTAPVDTTTPPPPPPAAASSSAPTSWLSKFIPFAFADTTTTVSSTSATTSTSASTVEGIPSTATRPSSLIVNTSLFQNIVLPSSTPNDFLALVYSTDGVTWQPITNINADDWAMERYEIPIHSWDELSHLQVAFVGLGSANSPKVYLDAVSVEVNYMDTPEGTTTVTPEANQPDAQAQAPATEAPAVPAGDILQKSSAPEGDIFEQGAKQQCVVAPFSQSISAGGTANFSLQLFSGLTTPSSAPKGGASTSTLPNGFQHATYQTRLGSLPPGVTSYIKEGTESDASSTQTIHISTTGNAAKGSYSLLVIYRERQDDASFRSTGCQLNLVIQ